CPPPRPVWTGRGRPGRRAGHGSWGRRRATAAAAGPDGRSRVGLSCVSRAPPRLDRHRAPDSGHVCGLLSEGNVAAAARAGKKSCRNCPPLFPLTGQRRGGEPSEPDARRVPAALPPVAADAGAPVARTAGRPVTATAVA